MQGDAACAAPRRSWHYPAAACRAAASDEAVQRFGVRGQPSAVDRVRAYLLLVGDSGTLEYVESGRVVGVRRVVQPIRDGDVVRHVPREHTVLKPQRDRADGEEQ